MDRGINILKSNLKYIFIEYLEFLTRYNIYFNIDIKYIYMNNIYHLIYMNYFIFINK